MEIKKRIEKLRNLMRVNQMDAYIIPSSDSHLSEYVADHFKCREFISGFTGSAGTVVITMEDAGLWTDGRYYIQAENQIKGSKIRLFKAADLGVPSYKDWLYDNLGEGSCVGLDGHIFSANEAEEIERKLKAKNISLKKDKDLIGEIWTERPKMPGSRVFVLELKYAGESRSEKLNKVREEMKNKGASCFLLTSLDDIAWLLNIRGGDVPNNPVVISNVAVIMNKCFLFIDPLKIPEDVKLELESENIVLKNYDETEVFLNNLKDSDTVIYDGKMTNAALYNAINKGAKKIAYPNITTALKAIKNKTELENLRNCQIADGVAMVKFIKWLKTSVGCEEITEYSAGEKLDKLRLENKKCVGLSFDTIAGYKENAAMMHYKADKDNSYKLKKEGMLLVDSGGQYYSGTTDITRTIVLGKLTEEEKRDFTLVLKSFIALSTAKFLYGTTDSELDILAREPIWKYGLDYRCGTGHGVGFFLNVHEGPQKLNKAHNNLRLEEGMITTNEPGIYIEGKHGIRTENMLAAAKDVENEYGQFMKFETLTYCPIDLAGVDFKLLTESEKDWLVNYNKTVYEKLSPYLNEEEGKWLFEETVGDF